MQFAQRGIHDGLAGIEAAAGQCPLRGMRVQPGRPAAQQERGATGDVNHAAVQILVGQRSPADPFVDRGRVDAVFAALGVHQHDGHRGVPLARVVDHPAAMAGQVRPDLRAQGFVVRDRHRADATPRRSQVVGGIPQARYTYLLGTSKVNARAGSAASRSAGSGVL